MISIILITIGILSLVGLIYCLVLFSKKDDIDIIKDGHGYSHKEKSNPLKWYYFNIDKKK